MYNYIQLDPRKTSEENPTFDLGVEITIPALAGNKPNLDHHGVLEANSCASMQALDCSLPEEGATLATLRPDLDSVTAMAVITARKLGVGFRDDILGLVHDLERIDLEGPSAFEKIVPASRQVLREMGLVAADVKLDLQTRVRTLVQFLSSDQVPTVLPENYILSLIQKDDEELEIARASSSLELLEEGRAVFVKSTHRHATRLGYELSPVVIAMNPAQPLLARQEDGTMKPTEESYVKYTICRYSDQVPGRFEEMMQEFQRLEKGWGGRTSIFGSPQNQSSTLTQEEVIAVVLKYLK